MSPEVQKEYDRILAAVAVREGALLDLPGARYYGWMSPDWQHLSQCGIASWGRAKEVTFTQFEGTFEEDTKYRSAIDVNGVNCKCGQLVDREVRWEPSRLGEVTGKVFEALYRELKAE